MWGEHVSTTLTIEWGNLSGVGKIIIITLDTTTDSVTASSSKLKMASTGHKPRSLDEEEDPGIEHINNEETGAQDANEKYWGEIEKLNPLLLVAVLLDPRYKEPYLKVCFEMMCGDSLEASRHANNVRKILDQMYKEYYIIDSNGDMHHSSSTDLGEETQIMVEETIIHIEEALLITITREVQEEEVPTSQLSLGAPSATHHQQEVSDHNNVASDNIDNLS
ncbi:hypothetical protein G4B88_006859 [Cannabis sativa]|uniref:hAT-like transposase RNase-H fold domain-containing protein n=1 Tax=Cannabis sativa TaxID=3483 RepID=A0A7J6G677_CANSA|nr:hypothetical protein G4B88_006859 [Cannabis sativa]